MMYEGFSSCHYYINPVFIIIPLLINWIKKNIKIEETYKWFFNVYLFLMVIFIPNILFNSIFKMLIIVVTINLAVLVLYFSQMKAYYELQQNIVI